MLNGTKHYELYHTKDWKQSPFLHAEHPNIAQIKVKSENMSDQKIKQK